MKTILYRFTGTLLALENGDVDIDIEGTECVLARLDECLSGHTLALVGTSKGKRLFRPISYKAGTREQQGDSF